MDIVTFFITHPQPPKVHQLGGGRLDKPAIDSQAAAVPLAAAGNYRLNPSIPQRLTDGLLGVIGPVGVELLGSATRTAARTLDRRYRLHQCDGPR